MPRPSPSSTMSTATATPATANRIVTDEERFLFDLNGYLVIPNALSSAQLAALNGRLDEQLTARVDPHAGRHRFIQESLLSWGQPYRDLIDNPQVMPYLTEFIGDRVRLDHDYADIIRRGDGETPSLHGGNTPFDECCFYDHRNGRIRCGLMVIAYNLHDVNPGDGGFGCIPGSHKSNYPVPTDWTRLDRPVDAVRSVSGPAGSAIIFTEALAHGTMPWKSARERRTVFYKYSPSSISWSAKYYDHRDYAGLTQAQRALLEAPNARYPGR